MQIYNFQLYKCIKTKYLLCVEIKFILKVIKEE